MALDRTIQRDLSNLESDGQIKHVKKKLWIPTEKLLDLRMKFPLLEIYQLKRGWDTEEIMLALYKLFPILKRKTCDQLCYQLYKSLEPLIQEDFDSQVKLACESLKQILIHNSKIKLGNFFS